MTLQERDKRALILCAVVASLFIGYWALTGDDVPPPVQAAQITSVPAAEQRLARLRQISASVPGKEEILKQAEAELASRESRLIKADTAAQAQEQLLQILRKLGKAPNTGIDLRNSEIGQVKPYGDKYGEVFISLNFEARVEQLVNLLSDLTAQKEIIGVSDLRVGAANPKVKTMPVRLTVSGLVRRELIPEKKGGSL